MKLKSIIKSKNDKIVIKTYYFAPIIGVGWHCMQSANISYTEVFLPFIKVTKIIAPKNEMPDL